MKRKQKDGNGKPGKSKYAIKHAEQLHGKYRPTSPFYLSPDEHRRLEQLEDARKKEDA